MPGKATACAIVFDSDRRRVLLQKREDFRIWGLPGGGIDSGETWEEAAVRETHEETGYRIAVVRLAGEYWRPQAPGGGITAYMCVGRVVGGQAITRGPETLEVRWFPLDALPTPIAPFHHLYIQDAAAEASTPVKRTLRMPAAQAVFWRVLIRLRDLRNWLTGRP